MALLHLFPRTVDNTISSITNGIHAELRYDNKFGEHIARQWSSTRIHSPFGFALIVAMLGHHEGVGVTLVVVIGSPGLDESDLAGLGRCGSVEAVDRGSPGAGWAAVPPRTGATSQKTLERTRGQ